MIRKATDEVQNAWRQFTKPRHYWKMESYAEQTVNDCLRISGIWFWLIVIVCEALLLIDKFTSKGK